MILIKNVDYLDADFIQHKNFDILIEDNVIHKIGQNLDSTLTDNVHVINGKNKLVMPGLFNLHSHVPMTLLRGYGEGLNLQDWLFTKIFPFEALLNKEDMYWGALLGISEFIATGTVSFTDMYMRIEGIIKAIEESKIKANICNPIINMDPNLKYENDSSYQEEMYLLDYLANNHSNIIAEAGIHAEYTSTPEIVEQVIDFADHHSLNLQIHISETKREHEECIQRRNGLTPIEYFEQLGTFKRKCILAHGVYITENDMEIIAKHQAVLVHNPASNFKLGSGFANLKKWQEKGINICIGTDGAASNNDLDLFQELRLAGLLANGLNCDPNAISAKKLLEIATINGAKAQNRNDTGIIKEGFKADLIMIDLDAPNMQPNYDICANLVFSLNQKNIYLTMIDGEIVYQNNEYKTIDIERVKFEANRIKEEKLRQLS